MKFIIVMLIFLAVGAYIIHHDGFNAKAGIISVILAAIIVGVMVFGDAKLAKTILAGFTVLIMVYDILAIMNPSKKAKQKAIDSRREAEAAKAEFEAKKAAAQEAAEEKLMQEEQEEYEEQIQKEDLDD